MSSLTFNALTHWTAIYMVQFTFTEAAKRAGVSRQTIYKYVSLGRLSATLAQDGRRQIDASELMRVFGSLQSMDSDTQDAANTRRTSTSTRLTDTVLPLELERIKMQLQARETELLLMRERLEELRQREQEAKAMAAEAMAQQNRLLGMLEGQQRLLEAPKKPAKTKTPTGKKKAAKSRER